MVFWTALLDFQPFGIAYSCAVRRWPWEGDQHSESPTPPRANSQETLLTSLYHSPHIQDPNFAGNFSSLTSFSSFLTLKEPAWLFQGHQDTTISHHFAHKSFINNKSRRTPFLVKHLCQEVLFNMLRNLLDLVESSVWYSQLISGKIKSPIRTGDRDELYIQHVNKWIINILILLPSSALHCEALVHDQGWVYFEILLKKAD